MLLQRAQEDTKDIAKVEQEPRAEGRTLHMLLTPLAKKV
jgi:translation initiation factor IF-3